MAEFENFIGFNPWTALFTLLNLVLTFLILKKFLFKPVNKMISDRQKEIDDLYQEAEQSQQQAKLAKTEYDERLRQAKAASDDIIQEARHEAYRQRDEILEKAHHEAEGIRQKAENDIALEKKKAYNEVKDDLSQMAMEIAEKLVERKLNDADQDRLFEEFLRDMEDHV